MYEIKIIDKTTNKSWLEKYNSEYLLNKRKAKIKKSKKLIIESE